MKIWFLFILAFLTCLDTLFAFDFEKHLKASYEGQEEETIYWHQVPVWPKDETRRTNDPQFSAHRGGLISYTNLFSGPTMFLIMPPVPAEHLQKGETKIRFLVNHSSVFQVHYENGFNITSYY